jgi:hypothetical protein
MILWGTPLLKTSAPLPAADYPFLGADLCSGITKLEHPSSVAFGDTFSHRGRRGEQRWRS